MAHPSRQHSHRLALALNRASLLERYYCGIPTSKSTCPWYLRPIWSSAQTWDSEIPPARVMCIPVAPCARNLVSPILGRGLRSVVGHASDAWFDSIVAGTLGDQQYSAVVAYENSARRLFEAAKRDGKLTILDAASVHYTMQDSQLLPAEHRSAHDRIIRNKDAEIGLADYILTTSPLARDSYVKAGVNPDRVFVIPMGVDVCRFGSVLPPQSSRMGVRFVFVGRFDEVKGRQCMLKAFEMANDRGLDATLTVVGNVGVDKKTCLPNVQFLGKQEHDRLPSTLAEHDVLILPSRFDSFGMVVVEAMAAGLPVIVSPGVGSRMAVEPCVNGLVMRDHSEFALLEAVEWYLMNRGQLTAMKEAAKRTAKQYSWQAYYDRVIQLFRELAVLGNEARRPKVQV